MCYAFGMSVHRKFSRLPWQFFRQQLREHVWVVPLRLQIEWTKEQKHADRQGIPRCFGQSRVWAARRISAWYSDHTFHWLSVTLRCAVCRYCEVFGVSDRGSAFTRRNWGKLRKASVSIFLPQLRIEAGTLPPELYTNCKTRRCRLLQRWHSRLVFGWYPARWRVTPCRLSATPYSTHSQLPSISGGRLSHPCAVLW
jgi:hypothetical protein